MNKKYKNEREKMELLEGVGAFERQEIYERYKKKKKIEHILEIPLEEFKLHFKQKMLEELKNE